MLLGSWIDALKRDLHLNPDKIQINVPNVPFLGQVLTKDGTRSTQGWCHPPVAYSYLCYWTTKFPWLSGLSLQVHSLSFRSKTTITGTTEIQQWIKFYWTQVHEKALNQLKEAIVKDVTLQFFNQDLSLHWSRCKQEGDWSCYASTRQKHQEYQQCIDTKQLMISCLCIQDTHLLWEQLL